MRTYVGSPVGLQPAQQLAARSADKPGTAAKHAAARSVEHEHGPIGGEPNAVRMADS